MNLTINKQIEETFEIETPSFWQSKRHGRFYMITERKIIMVQNEQLTIVNEGTGWFTETAHDAIAGEKITEVIFLEKLFDVQEKINEACGVSSIPTIFTQNNFRSFQKPLL
jgi:hypothetical protein